MYCPSNPAPEFTQALEALYAVSYTVKKERQVDYAVMSLEGLWWADDSASFWTGRKDQWQRTLMIMQPEYVTEEWFERARAEVAKKKNPPLLPRMRLERLHEGLSAKIMHRGPYDAEAPTVEKLHAFIKAKRYTCRGKHHEIYLGDPRRTAPEKLRTVLRQPVQPVK